MQTTAITTDPPQNTKPIPLAYWRGAVSTGLFTDQLVDFIYVHRKLLLAIAFLAYLLGFNGQLRIEPDASLYLSLGRNLATGHGYTYLWKPHHLAYPGLPWIIAGTFKVFGVNQLWPAHVVMLLMTFATLALVYRLFLLHSGPKVAVLVTLGVAITKTFFVLAYQMRSDMPFLLGSMAFLCGLEAIYSSRHPISKTPLHRAKWYDWALLIGGIAFAMTMRPTIWVLLLASLISVFIAVARGRVRWQAILVLAGVMIVAEIGFRALDPRRAGGTDDYESTAIHALTTGWQATLHTMLTGNLKELLSRATPDALMQVRAGPLNDVLGLVFITIGVLLVRERVLWGVLVALIVLTNLALVPLDRYYLPVIPLLVFAWWKMLRQMEAWLRRFYPHWVGAAAVVALLLLGLCSNLPKMGGVMVEQHSKPFLATYYHGEYESMPQLADCIQKNVTDENSVILVRHAYGRILNYLSGRAVVDLRHQDDVDLKVHPVYVVEPADPETEALLARYQLSVGPVLATVPQGHGKPVWTLNATRRP